ncbi:hypothetical protein E4U42_005695 [Claviceps africana]|uniref:Uncharacterized protein n=1 Tax=Claviceps africana TaxID=83212 RepID=A0A8K0J3J5_9HYPO|nr:hypothetical protein E4U42_005695 [Claviceps africana]
MKFSAPAALAAMVIYAGQTLAVCQLQVIPLWSQLVAKCSQSGDRWDCREYGVIDRSGNTFNIKAGNQLLTSYLAYCDAGSAGRKYMACTANARGSFDMDCPGSQAYIEVWEGIAG